MAKNTLSGFMIGLVIVGMVAAIISIFIVQLGNNYGVTTTGVNLTKYNQLNELELKSKQIKNNVTTINQPTGALEVFTGLFYNAYKVLLLIPQTFDLFFDMTDQAFVDSPLGTGGDIIKAAIVTIVLIIIFVSILLGILLNREV